MNNVIFILILLPIASTLGRICHSNEKCVALVECRKLLQSSLEVRAMYRCNQPRKFCCPINSNSPKADVSMQKYPEDCGSTPRYGPNRVAGGRPIEPDEYSWLASLEYGFHREIFGICSGAVINSRYVLTAAHCVTGIDIEEYGGVTGVVLGDFQKRQMCDYGIPGCPHFQRFGVEEIVIHKDYMEGNRWQIRNDIALLRLTRSITFSAVMQPICLPFGNNQNIVEPSADTWITIAGWGYSSSFIDVISKRAIYVPVLQMLQNRHLNNFRRSDTEICAGISGRGACHGDSGGPLMYEFENKRMVLEGILSFTGFPCETENFPSVSTRVRYFADWIDAQIQM